MKMKISVAAVLFVVLLTTPPQVQAQAPGIITYQGRITNNGTNFTGTGEFRFIIYREGPTTTLWSHDNSSVGGAMPNTAISLPVTNGLFQVGLGDTTVPGAQSQIPASAMNNTGVRLRIWFSDGVSVPAVIAEHALTSTGYALLAQTIPNGSVTSAKIASGAVVAANIAPGAVTSAQLADDISLTNLRLAGTGFGNGTETVTLDAATGAGQGALFTLRNGGGTPTWTLDADTTLRGSSMMFFDAFGQATLSMDSSASNGGGSLALRTGTNVETVTLAASTGAGQGSALHLHNGLNHLTASLDGDASGRAGTLALYNNTGALTVLVDGDESSGTGGVINVYNNAGVKGAQLDGQGASGGGELVLYKSNGTATIYLNADSAGDGRITTQVLEITGGADFSENFDIRSRDAQPGMLVKIDAAHPGELVVSDRAYDYTVAGVVSGAGGVKPGVRMSQRDTAANGKYPVALTGRVYCLVDADRGAIEPGDLITTSDTPGHGMRVAEHAQAHGAIVGKAMTGLTSGRGLVLLLVNLQ
jgi:hypothetical protein